MARAPRQLHTERLRLAAWAPGDASALRDALDESDAWLRPWIPFMRGEPRSGEETLSRVYQFDEDFGADQHYRYAAWRIEDGALVGEVMLLGRVGPEALEVGYWMHVKHAGQGYATEAVRALITLAFEGLGARRVVFRCDERNAASLRVPQKLGARRVEVVEIPEEGVRLEVWALERPLA